MTCHGDVGKKRFESVCCERGSSPGTAIEVRVREESGKKRQWRRLWSVPVLEKEIKKHQGRRLWSVCVR